MRLTLGPTIQLKHYATPVVCLVLFGCLDKPLIEIGPQIDFVSVSAGFRHTCGLSTDSEVHCWSRFNPRPQLVSDGIPFASVSTHVDHTCGIAVDGSAYCWGLDTFGQLGIGNDSILDVCTSSFGEVFCTDTPKPVAGDLVFTQLDVGFVHTCGVTPQSEVYCWGANGSGQLGVVTDTLCFFEFSVQGSPCSLEPVRVESLPPMQYVSAGRLHTCGLTDDGTAYCWGTGESGRLGIGPTEGIAAPTAVLTNYQFAQIEAGGGHTCAVTFENEAVCWGSNADLQLATSQTELACGKQLFKCFFSPQLLSTPIRFEGITASGGVGVAGSGPAVGGHTCGIVGNGDVYCWGLNESGQLVNHSDLRSSRPVKVNDEEQFVQIDAGFEHTCGIDNDKQIVCWPFGGPVDRWFVFDN